MAFTAVLRYVADWNPKTNLYRIMIWTNAGGPFPVPVNSETEYIAVLLMLGKAGVVVDLPGTGDLRVPERSPGS
jgi:hypothetical protein